jgi:2,3-bisphosphoglycerate-independent phosphoglycerate mutase
VILLQELILPLPLAFVSQGAPERWRLIKAHGTAVGLPTDDDMGNSEVGHNALGAGQIYAQGYATLIYMSVFFYCSIM